MSVRLGFTKNVHRCRFDGTLSPSLAGLMNSCQLPMKTVTARMLSLFLLSWSSRIAYVRRYFAFNSCARPPFACAIVLVTHSGQLAFKSMTLSNCRDCSYGLTIVIFAASVDTSAKFAMQHLHIVWLQVVVTGLHKRR